jgi:hypothetical protein
LGLATFEEIDNYVDKKKREGELTLRRSTVESGNFLYTDTNFFPGRFMKRIGSGMGVSAYANPNNSRAIRNHDSTSDIKNSSNFHTLKEKEQQLCLQFKIMPETYHHLKTALIAENKKNHFCIKSDAIKKAICFGMTDKSHVFTIFDFLVSTAVINVIKEH